MAKKSRYWQVYGIVDPDSKRVLYVGMTCRLNARIRAHQSNPESAVYEVADCIRQWGNQIEHVIFGTFYTWQAAQHLEQALISALPTIFNRTHLTASHRFWEPVRSIETQAGKAVFAENGWPATEHPRGDQVDCRDYRKGSLCPGSYPPAPEEHVENESVC